MHFAVARRADARDKHRRGGWCVRGVTGSGGGAQGHTECVRFAVARRADARDKRCGWCCCSRREPSERGGRGPQTWGPWFASNIYPAGQRRGPRCGSGATLRRPMPLAGCVHGLAITYCSITVALQCYASRCTLYLKSATGTTAPGQRKRRARVRLSTVMCGVKSAKTQPHARATTNNTT